VEWDRDARVQEARQLAEDALTDLEEAWYPTTAVERHLLLSEALFEAARHHLETGRRLASR
jgi:hypothetical protein